jgi:Carboxypeptidase regulatory-like domain
MKLHAWCVLLFCALILRVPTLMGQTAGTGALTGAITDSSGAVVPNAIVSATSLDTGQTRTATTGADGTYKFSLLPPGNYRVRIEAGGFKQVEIPSVTVTVTETAVLDRALEVGAQTQTVTVEADVEKIQTASSAMGSVVNTQTVIALPLSTRNYTNLLAMSAGSNADVVNASTMGKASTAISVNGGDITQNTYLQDGVAVNNWLSVNTTQEGTRYGSFGIPNPDTIEEFKIQTSTYDAGYGRNPGANVNIVTKSGTNDLHGTAFEFFRNTALNANDFFWNAGGHDGTKQVLNQNQYGGVLGGAIKKNKLFFFVSYQETDEKNGIAGAGYSIVNLPPIPTAYNTAGSRGTCSPVNWTMANVKTACDAAAQTFIQSLGSTFSSLKPKTPGSMSVAANGSNVNPVAINILQLQLPGSGYLVPGAGSGPASTTYSIPAIYKDHQGMGNWDYVMNGKNTLSGRYYFESDPTTSPFAANGTSITNSTILPGSPVVAQKDNQAALLKLTTLVSNNVVNEARVSYQRIVTTGTELVPFTDSQVGVSSIASGFNFLDNFTISPNFSFGAQKYADQLSTVNQFQWADQLSWSHRRHTIRTGLEVERVRADIATPGLASGAPTFQSFSDFLIGLPSCVAAANPGTCSASNPEGTNGSPSTSSVRSPGGAFANATYNDLFRLTLLSAFVQDDVKITPRLTLNLGLRWEWDGFPIEANGNTSGFWPSLATVAPPGTGCQTVTGQIGDAGGTGCSLVGFVVPHNYQGAVPAGVFQNNTNYVTQSNPPWDDFAPRIGFAWQPLATSRFVVRGGAGYFYELINGSATGLSMINTPAEGGVTTSGLASLAQPFIVPATIPGPAGTFGFTPRWIDLTTFKNSNVAPTTIAQNLTVPVTYEWNLNTQFEFVRNWVLELGYVGSHGIHQEQASASIYSTLYNLAPLASPTNPINGQTTNSAANVPDRVPYLGISPVATISGNQSGYLYNALQATVRTQMSHGLQFQGSYTYDRAFNKVPIGINTPPYLVWKMTPNTIYHPQRLVLSYTWNLPLGHPAGLLGKFVEGWSWSGVTTIQDGTPVAIWDSAAGSVFFGTGGEPANALAQICPGMTTANVVTSGPITSRLGGRYSQNGYLNPSAFCALPTLGSTDGSAGYGNYGQGTFLSPGQDNWDMSLAKLTKVGGIREDATLLFRVEFFNAFNHPQFEFSQSNDASNTNADVNVGSTFGDITSMSVNPRLIQFVLKYSF